MKREREDPFTTTTETFYFSMKKQTQPSPPPPPLPCIVTQTAVALVQNPHRLEAYVNQMPRNYLLALLDVIASGVLTASPMAMLLKNHNRFWYLVLQRFMREGFDERVSYKEIAFKAFGL